MNNGLGPKIKGRKVSKDSNNILTSGTDSGVLLSQTQFDNLIKAIMVHNNHVNITATWDETNKKVILNGQSTTTEPSNVLFYDSVYNSSDVSGVYTGTPSIVKLSSGRIVASNDYYGTSTTFDTTAVFYSDDNGVTWNFSQDVKPMFWAKLFEHNGDLFLLGTSARYGDIVVSKSVDNGLTWLAPVSVLPSEQAGFATASNSVIFKDGFLIFSAIVLSVSTVQWEPGNFEGTLLFGNLSDLTAPANWSRSNIVPMDTTQIPADITNQGDGIKKPPVNGQSVSKGFLEGNIIEKPDGNLAVFFRAETAPNSNYTLFINVNYDAITPPNSTMSTVINYTEMAGGNLKFTLIDDRATSGRYWTVANFNRYREFSDQRTEGFLISSTDLLTWDIHERVVGYDLTADWENEIAQLGFQYSDIILDGTDLLIATRVADETSDNWHDASKAVFTKVANFRNIPILSVQNVGMLINEESEVLSNVDGIAVIHDQSRFGNSAFMLNADFSAKPQFVNGAIQFSGSEYLRIKHHRKLNPTVGFDVYIVVEGLNSDNGGRLLSKATGGTLDIKSGDWMVSSGVGLSIQNTRGVYSDVTTGNSYIISARFDAVNGFIYNYLNGANRGQPTIPSDADATWDTDHLVLTVPYSNINTGELWMGARPVGSKLFLTGNVKCIKIFPTLRSEADHLAEVNSLKTKYSIY